MSRSEGSARKAGSAVADRPEPSYEPEHLQRILEGTRTIAVVGASTNSLRPSWIVTRYLITRGYQVIPINPGAVGKEIVGVPFVASLAAIPAERDPVDMITIFRNSEAAGGVVDEAIETLGPRGLKTIWMQIGVVNHAAAERAEAAGLEVVMNRCPKIEISRYNGELAWGGFNTGVISSKLSAPPKPYGFVKR